MRSIAEVGMARTLHIYNTLQIPKYLKTGKFMEFLSAESPANYLSIETKIIQLYMPEPDVQKNSHLSFFLSFCFPGLTQDYHDRLP